MRHDATVDGATMAISLLIRNLSMNDCINVWTQISKMGHAVACISLLLLRVHWNTGFRQECTNKVSSWAQGVETWQIRPHMLCTCTSVPTVHWSLLGLWRCSPVLRWTKRSCIILRRYGWTTWINMETNDSNEIEDFYQNYEIPSFQSCPAVRDQTLLASVSGGFVDIAWYLLSTKGFWYYSTVSTVLYPGYCPVNPQWTHGTQLVNAALFNYCLPAKTILPARLGGHNLLKEMLGSIRSITRWHKFAKSCI